MHDWVVSTRTDAATGNGLPEDVVDLDGVTHTTDTAEYRLAKFKMEFENHFDMHYALIYYVYTFFALMVDQRAKNMFLTYWGTTGKWQPWFYDNDTSFGINNEGQLVFDYMMEDTDQLDGANVYNGQNSVLWTNFRNAFPDEIKETYQNLRNNGLITYDKLIDQFITNGSDKWSESIYNEDMDFKYISMLRSDNDATNLPQVRGSGEEHFRYFVENRLNYCDSKWYASDYANDYISLRIYTPTTWAGVEPNPAITVTPFSDMYAGVRYKANGTLYQSRVSHGVPVTFRPQGETFESENNETFNDTETAVYGAHQLSSIGDLAPLYCGSVNVSNADKLIELKVGDGTEGYSNANLHELSVGTNKLLKKIDVQNCPNFTSVLDLSNCPSMEEVYAKGSSITGVNFPEAGVLKKAQLPGTITNFTLKHQLYVEELTFEGYDNIKTLWIENCPTVDGFDILSKAANVDRLRLTNVNLTYDTAAEMLALAERPIAGIDENGTNTDKMWIDGKCHIKELSGADYLAIKDAFPYMTITYDALVSQLIFMSEDGTVELDRQEIQNGGAGNYTGTTPTKESTAQYDFTFAGWSLTPGGSIDTNALKAVTADRMVYAAFSGALRSYTVRFYNGTTLLEAYTVEYGKDAVYKGNTPVNNSTGNPDDFEFYGWKPEPINIQGETNCYAQFYDLREITDDWATIAQACLDGTATDKYAIGAFKMLDIGEVSLPYEFNQGSAVLYNGEIHILGSVVSEYRTSHYKWDGTKWVEVSTLPYEFYYGSAVVFNGEIHILGGSGSSSGKKKHYKWNGSEWVSVSTLPYMFRNGVAVVYNNEIHIMGSEESSYYTSHYKWNGSSWSEVGELPYSFYTASGFIYNNEIHVLGSYDSKYNTAHYKYDGSSWISVSTLPQKLSNGHALVIGTDIYMIQWDEFYKYDGTNWDTCPNVPANVYEGGSVVLDGNIYVMGSSVSGNRKVFFSYTPETETWSKVGITESIPMEIIAHNHDELPDGVGKWEAIAKPTNTPQYGCAVTYQNEVHALGGNSSSSYTQHIKWDDTNSTWVTVSTLPYKFRSGCAVILNDEIHILGSYQTTNKTEHYKWNATDGWVSVDTLPYQFYCSSAVVLNNEIHILGSYDSSSRKYHYKWNGTEWVSVSTLPYNFYYGSAVVYNDEIHIFSGSGSSTGHYKWDGSAWTSVSTLPYNLQYGVATIINNEIHIFGGSDNPTGHYKWNGTEWTSMTTLPGNFENYPLAVCNGNPYIFISTSCYKLAGPSWEIVDTLSLSCDRCRAFEYENVLYIANNSKYVYKYDGYECAIYATMPFNTKSIAMYNGELYAYYYTTDTTSEYYRKVYKYDGSNWSVAFTFPGSNKSPSIVVYDGKLHFIAGLYSDGGHYAWDGNELVTLTNHNTIHLGTNTAYIYNDELYAMTYNDLYKYVDGDWLLVSKAPYPVYRTDDESTKVAVYGDEIYFAVNYQPFFMKYNGSEWGIVNPPDGFVGTATNNIFYFRNKMYTFVGVNMNAFRNPRATLTFFAKEALKDPVQTGSHANGYIGTNLKTCVDNIFDNLSEDVKYAIKPVSKYIASNPSDLSIVSIEEKCWLASANEVGFTVGDKYPNGEGVPYGVFTDNASRIRSNSYWWTRSMNFLGNNPVYYWTTVKSIGMLGTGSKDDKNVRIVFGFCI